MSRDKMTGIIAMIIGVLILVGSFSIAPQVGGSKNDIGAEAFPRITAGILIISGIGLFITSKEKRPSYFNKKQWKSLGMILGITLAYAIAMSYVGFLVTTAVYLYVVCTMFLRERKMHWYFRAIYALAVSGGIYLLFTSILNLPMPRGILI